jgi:hypothetical protein
MNLGNHQPISLEVEVENSLGCVWPEIVDAADFLANPPPDPEPLIESVLNKGEKMLVGGPAKIGKTWLALDLATAVASATPWLGFQTRRGRVLFINLELTEPAFHRRLKWICEVKKITLEAGQLLVWNLRGCPSEMGMLVNRFLENPLDDLSLIVPDPLYKTLGDRDENSAGDIADLLRHVDRLAAKTGAAVLLTHHFAKGAGGRMEIDQFSGSSVFVRDPDVLVNIQPHQEKESRIMTFTVRNGRSPDPVGLSATFPVMTRDLDLDLSRGQGAPPKREPKHRLPDMETFLALFPAEFDEANPEKSLLSSSVVRNRFAERGWREALYVGVIDEAVSTGLLKTTKGPKANQASPPLIANSPVQRLARGRRHGNRYL